MLRTEKGARNEAALSDLQRLQLDYWRQFSRHLRQSGSRLKPRTPRPQKWMSFAIGRSGFDTAAEINVANNSIQVSINLDGPDRLTHFHILHRDKAAIEAELLLSSLPSSSGVRMQWGERPDGRISRIQLVRSATNPADRQQWNEQHQWLQEWLEAFHRVFAPRVKNCNVGLQPR